MRVLSPLPGSEPSTSLGPLISHALKPALKLKAINLFRYGYRCPSTCISKRHTSPGASTLAGRRSIAVPLCGGERWLDQTHSNTFNLSRYRNDVRRLGSLPRNERRQSSPIKAARFRGARSRCNYPIFKRETGLSPSDDEALAEDHREPGLGLRPLSGLALPLLGRGVEHKIAASSLHPYGEVTTGPHRPTQLRVQSLDGVGGK